MAFNRRAARFMWGSGKGSPKGAAPVSSPAPKADQNPPPSASGAESGSVTGAAPRMTRRTSGLVAVACWRQGCKTCGGTGHPLPVVNSCTFFEIAREYFSTPEDQRPPCPDCTTPIRNLGPCCGSTVERVK